MIVRPTVQVLNRSSALSDDEVLRIVAALHKQVVRHWGPHWHTTATLTTRRVERAWRLVFLDDSDQAGALGYHDLTDRGRPQGLVFARTDRENGLQPSVTASHELLEMLGDPYLNLTALDPQSRRLYAYEVADPVEADGLGYEIDGVLVSDFVLPRYFDPQADGAGRPLDYRGFLTRPFALAPGGYMSYLDSLDGPWRQAFADERGRRRGAARRDQRERASRGELRRSSL